MGHAYAPVNLLTQATLQYRDASDVVKVPATASQFPLSYLVDSKPGRVFKWAAIELANIRAGLGTPVTATVVGLLNHNFAADSTHVLEVSIDGVSWGAASAVFSPDRTRYYKAFGNATGAFWRLRTTSWGSQAATPYLGELWLGQLVTFTRKEAWGLRKGSAALVAKTKTMAGQRSNYLKSSWEQLDGPWPDGMSTSELAEVQALISAVGYSASPFLFLFDTTDPTCWIAYLELDEYMPQAVAVGRWSGMPFRVSEQPFGAPVA